MSKHEWWRGGVFYQIYPRSFMDSNGDGVGDLKGITQKLDYVADLGVDAIWLSPFFKSPMKDFGYDVSDYRAVDPLFGTLADFDALLARAHHLGLKIIIDQVLNHTSDQHAWFQESLNSRNNAKADWYTWADPKPDGTPPNNWLSMFGGPAWTFNTKRGQYYLHGFLSSQPDLNFHNPAVQDALLGECRFWLERGVDGFRLDTANYFFCDSHLRDNPPRPQDMTTSANQADFPYPYNMQFHQFDKSQPENIAFLERLRSLLDEFGATMSVGEIGDDNPVQLAAEYTTGDKRLHTCYQFSYMNGRKNKLTSSLVRTPIETFFAAGPDSWPSWAFSNHDVVRALTRFGGDSRDPRLAKLLIALLCSLRGTAFIYQGEELGLPEATLKFEDLQDPWGISLWPAWQGRDGCRTPMPWTGKTDSAGFTSAAKSWLPVAAAHLPLNAEAQEQDKESVLNFTRQFLKWRKQNPALIRGDISFTNTGSENVLAFSRTWEDKSVQCLFNLTDQEQAYGDEKLPPYGYVFR